MNCCSTGVEHLLANNRAWAEAMTADDPDFFKRLVAQQAPAYLWIGCSDSRVPATQLVDLPPGEMFVHRNVANIVAEHDLNCLSVMHYAIDVLRVQHIIVCGHYGCGGVAAALADQTSGTIDSWLGPLRQIRDKHAGDLAACPDAEVRHDRLCELNVTEQVANVCQTDIVQNAWERRQPLAVHGWIYRLVDGRLRPLASNITSTKDVATLLHHRATPEPPPGTRIDHDT